MDFICDIKMQHIPLLWHTEHRLYVDMTLEIFWMCSPEAYVAQLPVLLALTELFKWHVADRRISNSPGSNEGGELSPSPTENES